MAGTPVTLDNNGIGFVPLVGGAYTHLTPDVWPSIEGYDRYQMELQGVVYPEDLVVGDPITGYLGSKPFHTSTWDETLEEPRNGTSRSTDENGTNFTTDYIYMVNATYGRSKT